MKLKLSHRIWLLRCGKWRCAFLGHRWQQGRLPKAPDLFTCSGCGHWMPWKYP
jgi:hypothetical protein